MPNRLYIRRFLNKRGYHAGGYIYAVVADTSKRKTNDWDDIEFTIADCGRQISLSFGAHPDDFANSLHKVDVLIDSLTRFRVALVAEGELASKRAKMPRSRAMPERSEPRSVFRADS